MELLAGTVFWVFQLGNIQARNLNTLSILLDTSATPSPIPTHVHNLPLRTLGSADGNLIINAHRIPEINIAVSSDLEHLETKRIIQVACLFRRSKLHLFFRLLRSWLLVMMMMVMVVTVLVTVAVDMDVLLHLDLRGAFGDTGRHSALVLLAPGHGDCQGRGDGNGAVELDASLGGRDVRNLTSEGSFAPVRAEECAREGVAGVENMGFLGGGERRGGGGEEGAGGDEGEGELHLELVEMGRTKMDCGEIRFVDRYGREAKRPLRLNVVFDLSAWKGGIRAGSRFGEIRFLERARWTECIKILGTRRFEEAVKNSIQMSVVFVRTVREWTRNRNEHWMLTG